MLAAARPWPSRADRRDSVLAARQGAVIARRKAAAAGRLRRDIESRSQELLARNHIAELIVGSLKGEDSNGS